MLFLKGILLGICVAAPIGPVGVLCIRRTLQSGAWMGLASGMGAAFADTLYAAVTVLGVAIVADAMNEHQAAVRTVGGVILILIALRAFFAKPAKEVILSGKTMASSCVSCFVLTVSNPATIIGFAALFAGLGMVASDDKMQALIFVLGVFSGSMMWWGFLSFVVSRMRFANLIERAETINKYLGVFLGAFGIWAIASAFI